MLNQYFQSVVANWKIYQGPRTPKQVLKIQAIYKQALYGDNPDMPPMNMDTNAGLKWIAWHKLRGMTKEMAKRRFITFCSEIDPLLIDVMPDEKPPPGFPLDRRGIQICAKCNTVVGCSRPLLDQNKSNLKKQLFENEEFHEPERFKAWVKNAIENQRCIWGVHKAIANADKKPFMDWFDRDENRGFFAYDSAPLMQIIHELVTYHHDVAYDMMQNKDTVDPNQYNAQSVKTTKLKGIYEQLAGEPYKYWLPCTRDCDACNQRRKGDNGKNHKHEQEIDPPTYSDVSTFEEAIQLRMQCQKLGISPCTGPVEDIVQRCDIYRKRIAEHLENLKVAAAAKARNDARLEEHRKEKGRVKQLSKDMFVRQCWEACHMNLVEHVLVLVRRGCNPNEESPKGLTPMLTLIMNDASVEQIEELIALKANINLPNKFGMTPLLLACRLGAAKMIHILMRNNASALQKDGLTGRMALHWCVIHGAEDLVRMITDYLKDGVGDAMRVTRFLDAQTDEGETPLMLAAKIRNGSMCHLLCSLGCNPNLKNGKGRHAAFIAREEGWTEIADWLEKKVGAGVAKLETFSDLQFEKTLRYSEVKMKMLINEFGKIYLCLMQNKVTLHPLGCPFIAKNRVHEMGQKELRNQKTFVDNHQHFIANRGMEDFDSTADGKMGKFGVQEKAHDSLDQQSLSDLKARLVEMLSMIRQGMTNPNVEAPPKPLSWTPLMCAVAVGDMRTTKLMLREGANPNYHNRNGMTAVMLAAQLNNNDVLVELLMQGGDMDAIDNEGYTALAYAGSLPLPSIMERDTVGILMEGDTDGPKLMNSTELLKAAKAFGVEDMKETLKKNIEASQPAEVELHFKVMGLLEQYGLTSLQTERQIHDQAKTVEWRVNESEFELRCLTHDWKDDYSESTGSSFDKYQDEAIRKYHAKAETHKVQKELEAAQHREEHRCPICTLVVPCAHFFKVSSLTKYLEKQSAAEAAKTANMTEEQKIKASRAYISKKMKVKNKAAEVLEEAHLSDRNTDRSHTLEKLYRHKEKEVMKITRARLAAIQAKKETLLLTNGEEGVNNDEAIELLEAEYATVVEEAAADSASLMAGADSASDSESSVERSSSRPSTVDTVSSGDSSRNSPALSGVDPEAAVVVSRPPSVGIADVPDAATGAVVVVPEVGPAAMVVYEPPKPLISAMKGTKNKPKQRVVFNYPLEMAGNPTVQFPAQEVGDDGSTVDGSLGSGGSVESGGSSGSGGYANEAANKVDGIISDSKKRVRVATPPSVASSDKASETALTVVTDLPVESPPTVPGTEDNSINLKHIPTQNVWLDDVGTNPFPPEDRRVFMFTRERLDRGGSTDGLVSSPSKNTRVPLTKPPRAPTPTSSYVPVNPALVLPPMNVHIAGWIFVTMADIHSPMSSLESISLPLDVWGGVLEYIQEKFLNEWMDSQFVGPLVDAKGWKPMTPRCSLCSIGFVRNKISIARFKENPEAYQTEASMNRSIGVFEDFHLCLPCTVRKALAGKVSETHPLTLKSKGHDPIGWPFIAQKKPASPKRSGSSLGRRPGSRSPTRSRSPSPVLQLTNDSHISPTAAVGAMIPHPFFGSDDPLLYQQMQVYQEPQHNFVALPSSPVRSDKLNLIDKLESQIVIADSGAANVIESIYGPSTSEPSDLESVGSDVSQLTMSVDGSTSTPSTISTISAVDPIKKPKEMNLIPFLIAKGHFEEVERTVRITLGKTAVDEGEGMLVLLKILQLQAEMYKAMGLWPLALGIYLDCADLTYALLGFSDFTSMSALKLVTSCLRKMKEMKMASEYVKTLCGLVDKNLMKKMKNEIVKNIKERDK